MRNSPRIEAILNRSNLTKEYRQTVELAAEADRRCRSYAGSGNVSSPQSRGDILAEMHADLINNGLEQINGMDADLWIARSLREYERF